MEPEFEVFKCTECFRDLPTAFFSPTRTVCRQCTEERRVERAEEKLKEQARSVMSKMLDENFVPTAGSAALMDVVGEIYTNFGGPRGFAKRFTDQVTDILDRKPAMAAGATLLLNFMRLHHKLEETAQKQNVAELTDEQLRKEQEFELLKFYVDAANDPVKRLTLEQLLNLHGIKLVGMTAQEILEPAPKPNDTDLTTSERTGPGIGTP